MPLEKKYRPLSWGREVPGEVRMAETGADRRVGAGAGANHREVAAAARKGVSA